MKKELQAQLYEKYPALFQHKDNAMSCMNRGMVCGDGWYSLINSLCANITWYCEHGKCPQVIVDQVKEKFGGLRYYYHGGDEKIGGMVSLAEEQSFFICEECGVFDAGEVSQNKKGWVQSLCRKCRSKV